MDVLVGESLEYRYVIDGFTPETLPMSRLAEYVHLWATLLGENSHVHFERVERGSTVLVAKVEKESVPKVQVRVRGLQDGTAPPDVRGAYRALNDLLVKDNSSGRMEGGAEIIPFPGIKRVVPEVYGPFNQDGTLDGRLVRIGGRKEKIKAVIDDGQRAYPCDVTKEQAKKLAALFVRHGACDRAWTVDARKHWGMESEAVQG